MAPRFFRDLPPCQSLLQVDVIAERAYLTSNSLCSICTGRDAYDIFVSSSTFPGHVRRLTEWVEPAKSLRQFFRRLAWAVDIGLLNRLDRLDPEYVPALKKLLYHAVARFRQLHADVKRQLYGGGRPLHLPSWGSHGMRELYAVHQAGVQMMAEGTDRDIWAAAEAGMDESASDCSESTVSADSVMAGSRLRKVGAGVRCSQGDSASIVLDLQLQLRCLELQAQAYGDQSQQLQQLLIQRPERHGHHFRTVLEAWQYISFKWGVSYAPSDVLTGNRPAGKKKLYRGPTIAVMADDWVSLSL